MARAEGDNRSARYVELLDDGREQVVYRASALTLCPSAFQGLALGHEPSAPPPKMMAAFEQGHEAEPMILGELEAADKMDARENLYAVVLGEIKAKVEVEIFNSNKKRIVVRGALDDVGFVSRTGRDPVFREVRAVIEAKNFGMGYWSQYLKKGLAAFPSYEWQLTVYMLGMRRPKKEEFIPALFACRSKDTEKILVQWIDKPPHTLGELVEHVIDLEAACEDAIQSNEIAKCTTQSYPCPMWKLHDVAIEMPTKEVDVEISESDDDYKDFAESVDDWLDAKADELKMSKKYNAAKDWRDKCAEIIRTMLTEREVDPSMVDGVRVKIGARVVLWKEEAIEERIQKAHTKTTFSITEKP